MTAQSLAANETQTQCKVCHGAALLYGVVDFNKNCEEHRGMFLPLSGIPVYYHQCGNCGLVFTRAFDGWDKSDYRKHIYNDDYIKVDPDYLEARPGQSAKEISNLIKKAVDLKLLDYGGGNGRMSALLTAKNIDCKSWDPMETSGYTPIKNHFDLVTAFEVFEHTATPLHTAEEALGFLGLDGVLVFSTHTIDSLPPRAVHFWYISPRNGHITIYSRKSLAILFSKFGYKIHHFNEGSHVAYKTQPQWLK